MKKTLFFCFIISLFSNIKAVEPNDPIVSRCFVTKPYKINTQIPIQFSSTNNLRPYFHENNTESEMKNMIPVKLNIRALDKNCVPVNNARVNIWYEEKGQTYTASSICDNLGNSFFYLYLPNETDKDGYNKAELNINIHSNRLGGFSSKTKFKTKYDKLAIDKYKRPEAYLDSQQNEDSKELEYYLHLTFNQGLDEKTY